MLSRNFIELSSIASSKLPREMTVRAFAAACMVAASPATLVLAQSGPPPATLPPVVVEGQKAQPKAPAQKKASPRPQAVRARQVAPPPSTPVVSQGGSQGSNSINASTDITPPGGNPYANPNAPYMVQRSASGKLTEPLVNTPRTVTAVPKEVIDDTGVRDLRDLARDVPGLTIGSAEGGNSYGAFAVRGFKANNDIFVDGIRNPGNVVPDVFAVQQVEIYKGASGGIAGRSTIGGAINFITKQPDLNHSFYEVASTIGTDNTFRTTIDANQQITPNFAFRANLMYDQHDVAGRDITESERWGGLISATARVSDSLKITLDYYRYRNDAIPDWGVPVRDIDNVPVTELGIRRNMWVGMKGLDFLKEKADVGTATIVAKLAEGVTVTNKSRVGEMGTDYVATSMEGYPDVHHPNRDQTARIYANQTEASLKFNTGTFHHNVVAGIEVTRETIDRFGYSVSNNFDVLRPFPPNPYTQIDQILGKGRVYDATITTIGTYLGDTIHLSKEWIVNAGIRFDDFERDQVGGPGVSGNAQQNITNNTANVQADLFSWHAGIVYKPIPISSFYVSYATSQSPIGSELDSTGAQYNGISSTLVDVPPQRASSIEVGTKWELFDKRLLATAALFRTDVDHARTNDNVTPGNDTNAFAGEYRVQGIELGLAGNITRDWRVFGGLVALESEVLASSNPQDIGRRLANVPQTQFALLSRYQLTPKWALGGSATYGGEIFGGHLAANAANNHTVDWWRFDAFTEYKMSDHLSFTVSGLNLTDELYYDAIYQAADTFAFVAPGRAGYLTVKWKY
ncbi:MAG: TonB-dependent siderophore receptor [Hyphomicrobiaceae bacterium]